jgi:hypothetical protein
MAEYVRDYTNAMSSLYNPVFNPLIMNQVLKNINMLPASQHRAELIKMVHNPKDNEQKLRRFCQYLYNVQMPFKRLVHYYADMLTYDLSVYPINASEKEMKSKAFKEDYEKIWTFLGNFNFKKEFTNINTGMLLEDAKFMYLRSDGDRITFQEMPVDYCLIDSKFEYGWCYSFDLNYFHQQGVDINAFAPEFKSYYEDYRKLIQEKSYMPNIRAENRNGRWCYWQQINPKNSWVFKFHSIFAGLVPPLLGMFVDANEIDNFKNLQAEKTALDMFKLLIGTIPTNKSKDSQLTDDLSISAEMAGQFNKLINDMLPSGIKFGTVPFDQVKQFDFSQNTQNKTDIVGEALRNFYKSSGSDQALFNSEKPNAATMKVSTANDVSFANVVYREFESFLDYQFHFLTGKYKFKAKLQGTIYDEEERLAKQMQLLQYGVLTPDLAPALHLTEKELRDGLSLMKSLGYEKMFTPIQSANTMASNQNSQNGRPEKKIQDLTESGQKTKDTDANVR